MGDIYDAYPFAAQLADEPQKDLGLMVGQAGRGLVHDKHPSVHRKRLGDFDKLLLADRQITNEGRRIHAQANTLQHQAGLSRNAAGIYPTAAVGLPSEENIGAHIQRLRQVQLLVDQGNSKKESLLHRVYPANNAFHQKFPGVRSLHAG